MKFYHLLCFVILFVVINCDKIIYKGEENEIIGNIENYALSVNSKTSKLLNQFIDSLIKPVVPHNEFNVSFKPLLNIFNEKDEQSNNHNSGLSSKSIIFDKI